jgi:hypothetical protein
MSEGAEDLQHKPCATADLCHPFHAKQMPNVTPNAKVNFAMPLNVSKHQCHFDDHKTVIATIIVTCQTHKTTAQLQLNRLQQSTIS